MPRARWCSQEAYVMTVVKPLDRNEVEQRRVERKKVVMRELRRRQREEALRSRPPAPISLVTGRS